MLFASIALLLVLGLIEGAVRAYHFARSVGAPADEPRGYVMDDAESGYSLKPGYHVGNLRVNSLGFRGAEVQREKSPGTFRLVALGDSATFGPHEEECAYPYLLPALLPPSRQVESVNAAIEGYRTDRALAHLRKRVLPLRPDMVIVFIGWNDLFQTDPRQENDQLSLRGSPLATLLNFSEAAQSFRRTFFLRVNSGRAQTQGAVADDALLASYRPEGYGERLREIFRTVRGGGAEVVTLTWPTVLAAEMSPEAVARVHYPWYTQQLSELKLLYARYQETLRRVAAEEEVTVIDTARLFEQPMRERWFLDTAHFTCEAQAMVAREVAETLSGTRALAAAGT